MKTTKKTRSHGTIVHVDDLELGQFYTVHGLKNAEDSVPVAGIAFRLTGMNLPFLVGKLVPDPAHPPITFDVRYLNFMRVTDDFVNAQRPAEEKP